MCVSLSLYIYIYIYIQSAPKSMKSEPATPSRAPHNQF